MDYNEIAAHLEDLFERLSHYRQRERENLMLIALFVLSAVVTPLILIRVRFLPLIVVLGGLLLIAMIWLGKRVMRTRAEAAELEREVELLRYRLVAEDVSLGKPKRDGRSMRRREPHLKPEDLVNLGRLQVGDDGELIITPAADKKTGDQRPNS